MIPRIIHRGWFGKWRPGPLNEMCFASWARVLGDYEMKTWTNENGPMRDRFFATSIEKFPINAHNYIGLWALYRYGGVMLDNDVEVLRPFDLNHEMFIGFQRKDADGMCINNAVIGAVPKHPAIGACLRQMTTSRPHDDPLWFGCGILTEELRRRGLKGLNVEQKVGDIMVYDRERFYPYFHDEPVIPTAQLGERTFSVHHWQKSWIKP